MVPFYFLEEGFSKILYLSTFRPYQSTSDFCFPYQINQPLYIKVGEFEVVTILIGIHTLFIVKKQLMITSFFYVIIKQIQCLLFRLTKKIFRGVVDHTIPQNMQSHKTKHETGIDGVRWKIKKTLI